MLIAPPGKLSAVYEWQLQSSSFTIYQCFLWHTPKANHHFSLVFNVTLLPILQTSRAHKEIIFGFECLFIVLQCSLIHCVTPLCYIRRHGSLLKQRSKKVCRARREVRNVTTNPFQLSTKHPRFKPVVCPGEKPIAPLIFIISLYMWEWRLFNFAISLGLFWREKIFLCFLAFWGVFRIKKKHIYRNDKN